MPLELFSEALDLLESRGAVELFTAAAADHRITYPGEAPPETGPADLERGGTAEAGAALGGAAWPGVLEALRLHAG